MGDSLSEKIDFPSFKLIKNKKKKKDQGAPKSEIWSSLRDPEFSIQYDCTQKECVFIKPVLHTFLLNIFSVCTDKMEKTSVSFYR